MTNNEQDCADFKEFWGEEAVTRHYDDITDAELLTLQVWGACQAVLKLERERQASKLKQGIKDALEQAASIKITFAELKTTDKNMLLIAEQMKLALNHLLMQYRTDIRALIQTEKVSEWWSNLK